MRGNAPELFILILKKKFIKAEICKYDDFMRLGSRLSVKEAGLLGLEGKEYLMRDGDIVEFKV